MKSYIRYRKNPPRRISSARYPLFRAQIGYLYRAEGKILAYAYSLCDPQCRDGAMLRLPPQTFTEIYYSRMMRHIRNDAEQEAAAVYFDPYAGRFLVVGSRQLYLDARARFGSAGNPLFLEDETPFRFDADRYGAYEDPDTMSLVFEDYFVPDVTGITVAECMTAAAWDDKEAPWHCALDFFNRYYESMMTQYKASAPDPMTALLAMAVRAGNHALLARLFALIPQTLQRFRPILREEAKFTQFSVPSPDGTSDPPRIFNLFQYMMLTGDPDTMETLFRFYERPKELAEFLHHPIYHAVMFYHIRAGHTAALAMLLSNGASADCADASDGRIPSLALSCRCRHPAMTAILLRAGSDPEKTDAGGLSALDYAAAANSADCLFELLCAMEPDRAREAAAALAARIPLSDDNQALLSILERFIH